MGRLEQLAGWFATQNKLIRRRFDQIGRVRLPALELLDTQSFFLKSVQPGSQISAKAFNVERQTFIHLFSTAEGALTICDGHRFLESQDERYILRRGHHTGHPRGTVLPEAFYFAFSLNVACDMQMKILACNEKVLIPPPEVCERHYNAAFGSDWRADGSIEWPGLRRTLDAEDASYAT